jgi:hypothetical protein
VPEDLIKHHNPRFSTLKITLGEDEVVLLLPKDCVQSVSSDLNRLENRSLDTSPAEVKPSATGGLGLFATKDFLPGDLVLSERPMVSALSDGRGSSELIALLTILACGSWSGTTYYTIDSLRI